MRWDVRALTRQGTLLLGLVVVGWSVRPQWADLQAAVRDPQALVDLRGPESLVLLLIQLIACGLCGWTALACALLIAASRRPAGVGARLALAAVPRALRRPVAAALGVGVLALTACGRTDAAPATSISAPPAYAASSDGFDWPAAPPAEVPAEPGAPQTDDPGSPAAEDASDADLVHVVQPGDCLWSIAADRLGPGASAAETAYLVDEIYFANTQAIGADPNLLHPGTALTLPAA